MAAAAAMFAACSENEVLNVAPETAPNAIGFSTFAGKATRAENNHTNYTWNLEDHHNSFTVYAGKLVEGTTQAVYSDAKEGTVTCSGGNWGASPLKYWDKTATEYYFYAGAPANASWQFAMTATDDYSKGYLKYEYFTLAGENIADGTANHYDTWAADRGTNDVDLMIAAPNTVGRAAYNKATPNLVTMEFNHILSRLNIKVKKGANIDPAHALELTSLTVYGLKNKGSFDENKAVADQTAKNTRWYDQDVDGTYVLTAASTSAITDAVFTHQYLVIPQDAAVVADVDIDGTTPAMTTAPYFRIDYTIDGEAYFAYYNLAAAFSASGQLAFCEGWENTLTITINPAVIEFDATVAKWEQYETSGKEVK